VATLEILHDEAKAWGRRAASALSERSDWGKGARLRGGGCGSSGHQEHIKEVSFPAVTPEEREIHQQAATGDPIERRRPGNVYDEAESIWEAMRAGEAILVLAWCERGASVLAAVYGCIAHLPPRGCIANLLLPLPLQAHRLSQGQSPTRALFQDDEEEDALSGEPLGELLGPSPGPNRAASHRCISPSRRNGCKLQATTASRRAAR